MATPQIETRIGTDFDHFATDLSNKLLLVDQHLRVIRGADRFTSNVRNAAEAAGLAAADLHSIARDAVTAGSQAFAERSELAVRLARQALELTQTRKQRDDALASAAQATQQRRGADNALALVQERLGEALRTGTERQRALADATRQRDALAAQLLADKDALDRLLAERDAARREVAEQRRQIDEGRRQIDEGRRQLDATADLVVERDRTIATLRAAPPPRAAQPPPPDPDRAALIERIARCDANTAEQQAAIDELLARQQDPDAAASPWPAAAVAGLLGLLVGLGAGRTR